MNSWNGLGGFFLPCQKSENKFTPFPFSDRNEIAFFFPFSRNSKSLVIFISARDFGPTIDNNAQM